MLHNICMQDQVTNKIEDIMNHYKKKPIDGIMNKLKKIIKKGFVVIHWNVNNNSKRSFNLIFKYVECTSEASCTKWHYRLCIIPTVYVNSSSAMATWF